MTNAITTTLPLSAADVALMQREAEDDRGVYESLTCTSSDEYEFADALLSEVKRRDATARAMCQSATKPLYGVVRTVEGWFKPLFKELLFAEVACKRVMSEYQSARGKQEAEARELAAQAADTGDADALITALEVASDASRKTEARASVTWKWELKRVIPGMVLDSWKIPDEARARAHAASAGNAESIEPVPGFVFERVAKIGGRK